MYVAALDLGTTGCRTFIYDLKGNIKASDYQEWDSFFPEPAYVEQDANVWWASLKTTIKNAIKKARIKNLEITSCSIANQRETIVPISKDGKPLHNAIVWQDRRTINQVELIKKKIGIDPIYKTTGLTIDPYFSLTKILWFKENKPKIYKNTWKFMLVSDFIIYKLTGICVSDYSNASRTMLFDINDLKYSEDIASELEIDLDKLPETVSSGDIVSKINISETEFDKTTQVVSGAGDQQAAALGVGVTAPGEIKCTTGTGSFILAYLDKPSFDLQKRVLCSCHAIDNTWIQEASIFTSGAALRWFRDEIGHAEREMAKNGEDPYILIDKEASKSPPGANGLIMLTHLVGAGAPFWNPHARGVLFGLSLGHKRKDLYRAVLEGVAYDVRRNIEVFKDLGLKPSELKLTGGGARSDLWNQIYADVLNITCVRNVIEEATSLGAAILAACGAGLFSDVKKAAMELCQIDKKWYPNDRFSAYYDKYYKYSTNLYELLSQKEFYMKFSEMISQNLK
ncbi:MAG: FGGY-family carbohydrate kinase [Promethearchaeota archaeon]